MVLSKLPEIESVPKIMVHYINMVRCADTYREPTARGREKETRNA